MIIIIIFLNFNSYIVGGGDIIDWINMKDFPVAGEFIQLESQQLHTNE